jgi:hypothetical protein
MMSRSDWLPLKSIIVASLSEYFLEVYPARWKLKLCDRAVCDRSNIVG